jgi:acetyl-CoA acetyltransferase
VAKRYGIGRDAMDEYGAASQQRATAALEAGLFNVVQSMKRFAKNPLDDAKFWEPAPLLARLVAEGKTFNA